MGLNINDYSIKIISQENSQHTNGVHVFNVFTFNC